MVMLAFSTAVVVPLIYFRFTPFAHDRVAVNFRPSCENNMDPSTRSSSRWENGTLVVDISEVQNCGESQQSLAVQRIGAKLFVRTTYASESGLMAACLCRQDFSLTIPGMPEQSYEVNVYNFP